MVTIYDVSLLSLWFFNLWQVSQLPTVSLTAKAAIAAIATVNLIGFSLLGYVIGGQVTMVAFPALLIAPYCFPRIMSAPVGSIVPKGVVSIGYLVSGVTFLLSSLVLVYASLSYMGRL